MVIVVVFTKITTGKASFFGLRIYSIITNSMEPDHPAGSLILENSNIDVKKINKGDIITFDLAKILVIDEEEKTTANTHRVVGFYYYDKNNDTHASTYEYVSFDEFYKDYNINQYEIVGFRTKGDNPKATIDPYVVVFESVEAKFVMKLQIFEWIYNIVMKPLGFIFIIIIPMLSIIVVQIVSTIRRFKKKDNDDENNSKELDVEEIKRQAIEEYKKNHPEL